MRLKTVTAGLLGALLVGIALVCPAGEIYRLVDDYVTLRDTGDAVQGAWVYFYEPNNTTTITAYTDLAHTTAVEWPLETDADGYFSCYVAPGTRFDRYVYHAGRNVEQTTGHYLVGEPDTLEFDVGRIDTLKPTTGRTVYGRAASGIDRGILDYARIDVDTLRADTLYVYSAAGGAGAIDASVIYADTLKSGLDDTVRIRATDGQHSGVLDVAYVLADELDATLVYADTAKCGSTVPDTFFIRSNDGQNDATLDVAYIDGVVQATVETLIVEGQILGGTRDYIWLDNVCSTNIAENTVTCVYHTYDSNGQNVGVTGIRNNESWGLPFIRDGSITGLACQYGVEVAPLDAADSVFVRVFVNGDSVFYASAQVDTSGIHGAFPVFYTTQAPGVSTFTAGDKLNALWGSIGTGDADSKYRHPYLRIEVQYDN